MAPLRNFSEKDPHDPCEIPETYIMAELAIWNQIAWIHRFRRSLCSYGIVALEKAISN